MAFFPCLSRKRPSWDLACACDLFFPMPVEEKAIMGLACREQDYFSTRQVCFGPHRLRDFAPLSRPQCWSAAARRINTFRARRARNFDHFRLLKSDDLSKVKILKKGGAPDTRCSWTRRALAMDFSPCLSKNRPSHGPSVRLRWAFPPAGRGKGNLLRKEVDHILVHCEPCI